jgi:hypothetical protein
MSKQHVHEVNQPHRGPMPKNQAGQAKPSTTPRGHMPNAHDEDHDQAATEHPTGQPMTTTTTTATPTDNANDPNGAPMPKAHDEDHDQPATEHPTGEPMTATTTTTANHDDPNGACMPDRDEDHDQAATDHPTGEPMTATTTTTANPDAPKGAPMPTDQDEPIPDTVPMVTPKDAARAALDGVVRSLGRDEIRVLTFIAGRLAVGQRQYGPLLLAVDPREFRGKEAREEIEDALVYLACAWLKAETLEVN